MVEGGEIPYLPGALEKQRENFANRFELDPERKCYMPGVPRATYMPYPFQIIQSGEHVMIAYEYASASRDDPHERSRGPRRRRLDGRSVGRWEGDTLVVDVTSQTTETWLDRAGNFHSDELHVVERYTLMGPNHLLYEATLEDPKVFTRPWKISLPLYRRIEPKPAARVQVRRVRRGDHVRTLAQGAVTARCAAVNHMRSNAHSSSDVLIVR